jgi:hypothetical protein
MVDEEFFTAYNKSKEKEEGIPSVEMNAPLNTNLNTGDIGLELEMEGQGDFPGAGYLEKVIAPATKSSWVAKADGSLRGDSREYVFSAPCVVQDIPFMVNGLFETLNKVRVKLDNSNRCSTHVHLNMKGYKINQLTSILILWYAFEEALINWCGEMRKTNHFALGQRDSLSTPQAWTRFLKTGEWPHHDGGLKYSAMNILPLFRLGSFEIRCGPSPDTPEIPIEWATAVYYLSKYAANNYQNPMTFAYDLSEKGGAEIFRDIYKDVPELQGFVQRVFEVNENLLGSNMDRMVIEGFRNIQHLALGFPWDKWLPQIDKQYIVNPFVSKMTRKVPRMRTPQPAPTIARDGPDIERN